MKPLIVENVINYSAKAIDKIIMSGECVKVIVRCRPINQRELDLNCEAVVEMVQGVTCYLTNPQEPNVSPKEFSFDGAYHVDSVTEQIYNDMGFPLVESVLEGYNGTVFAYGQTGCGKSFTMQGVEDPSAQRGIIPRSFEHIFEVIQTTENMKFLVMASYLEIYNEDIRDLLGTETKKRLDLKEHPDKGVFVQDLSQHPVHNTQECEVLMGRGWKNRATGATLMNADSSRSHSIFTITLEMMNIQGPDDSIRTGKLNLVDLAGSERQAKTGATGDRLKEATKINLSLSALGNVISALVDGKSKHIPYRDSKLTRLLQDSLGGNTKTLMIACLSPADNNYDETLSTLRYANRAKNIKNKPKINEDPKDAMLREYQEEIKKLKDLLAQQEPMETVVSVAPDEKALEEEREKVRLEYEEKMKRMKQEMEAEQKNNALLQANMESLRLNFEDQLSSLNEKISQKKLSNASIGSSVSIAVGVEEDTQTGSTRVATTSVPPSAKVLSALGLSKPVIQGALSSQGSAIPQQVIAVNSVKMQEQQISKKIPKNANDHMSDAQDEVLKRLKEIEEKMVGGEKVQDNELKAKRMKRKKYMEKRLKILSDALKNVDNEDGIMLKVYDDIHEELREKTDLAKKQKQRIKTLELEIKDLTSEFQEERTDFLETVRRQEQQVKLLQSILDRIQPTVRRDCNYSNIEVVKKEAIWDDEYQRWKIPDLALVKTKLPPAGGINIGARPKVSPRNSDGNGLERGGSSEELEDEDDEDESTRIRREDHYLKKLQRGEEENIAGNYFKPKRAKEILVQFKDDTKAMSSSQPKLNTTTVNGLLNSTNLATSFNLNGSFNNGSFNTSWGASNGSNGNYLSNGASSLNGSHINSVSNGWLGNTLSSISPETSVRRPTRLEALPGIGRKKNNRDSVLHTLDLI